MLEKTRGIVLSFIRYKETSIIAKIYTSEFGLQSYIVNGVRSKRSRTGMAFFQPLTLLDLVVYHKENKNLKRISEIKCLYPYRNIFTDHRKAAVASFVNELLVKTLKEEAGDPELFSFLSDQMLLLDNEEFNPDYPMAFAVRLSGYMGFYPASGEQILGHGQGMKDEQLLSYINTCLAEPEALCRNSLPATRNIRRKALHLIMEFFAWHVENFGRLNSMQVLQEVYG